MLNPPLVQNYRQITSCLRCAPLTEQSRCGTSITNAKYLQERRPDLYPQFLELLSEYRTPPCNLDRLRLQVEELLKDEPGLLAKFEEFLPKERDDVEIVGHGQDGSP